MELKLIVLAGAKEGTQIPLKKDKFVIGRASECTLRAGSEAISRRHCAITRVDGAWVASDLGSRNGTYINDKKIDRPTPLAVGDALRVGPLKFRVEEYVKQSGEAKAAKPAPVAAEPDSQDINRAKQPPIKDISDVIARTVTQHDGATTEDDVSRWLLGVGEGVSGASTRDTRTLSMEETATLGRQAVAAAKVNGEADLPVDSDGKDEAGDGNQKPDSGSGGWSFFKKGAAKKKPGKLPPRPAEATKDSREAAADILREMTRRR
jgi:pSer/pThr/pTyr-binding forkhead associated (FHA) protein